MFLNYFFQVYSLKIQHNHLYIYYTLYKNKQGELKIINIIIDGINIGLTFRNQFQDNLKNENYDLDKAIETWKPLYID